MTHTAPEESPAPRGKSRDERIAFATVLLSSANIIALQLYGSLMIVVNLIAYLVIHGHPVPRHQLDARSSDGIGLYPFPVPWWAFAIGGAIVVVVALVSWSPRRRFDGRGNRRLTVVYQTGPGFLVYVGFFLALIQSGVIGYFDGTLTVFSLYNIGPYLCVLGGIIAFVRWQKDARDAPVAPSSPKRALAAPSRLAEALGILVAVDFFALIAFGFGGVLVNQVIYLSAHGGALPPGASEQNATGTRIWAGSMPIDLPWWLFVLFSAVLVVVVLATWPAANQFGPQLRRRVFFRRTTGFGLLGLSLIVVLVELSVNVYYVPEAGRDGSFAGPLIALAAAILAVVRARIGPQLTPRADARPRTRKAA